MRGRKRRKKPKPPCQKKNKKRYQGWQVNREMKNPKSRFYWCTYCRAYHRTSTEAGIGKGLRSGEKEQE